VKLSFVRAVALTFVATGVLVLIGMSSAAKAQILLDADTPETGSNLATTPLVTSFGTITFAGQVRATGDPDLIAAGSVGNVFNVGGTGTITTATLSFDFDVTSIQFLYGGNVGNIQVTARNINGGALDSFFQTSTANGLAAGPETLSATGIRSIVIRETDGDGFAALDNIQITVGSAATAPEPGSIALALVGGIGLMGAVARRRKA
jgi:hypothetical protein